MFLIIITWETMFEGEREGWDIRPPQGQGWNALAGAGHRVPHIWRLAVTSSPCLHPSAHVPECVSFTKYSVCRSPVNAWLLLASAHWSALLAGAAHMQTYAYGSLDVMHSYCTSILTLQERNGIWIWECSVFFCWVHLTQDKQSEATGQISLEPVSLALFCETQLVCLSFSSLLQNVVEWKLYKSFQASN